MKTPKTFIFAAIFLVLTSSSTELLAQKKNVFMTGERLTYKVKYGFVKLGTIVFETGACLGNSQIKTKMKFWTAQVPFLDSKDVVDDIIDTTGICVLRFEEHGHDGKDKLSRTITYDPGTKILSYSDDTVKNLLKYDIRPFSDALTLFYNLRTWNGCRSNYFFPLRGANDEKLVKCSFSQIESKQECPAFEDKEVNTYRIDGFAETGKSAPLGASGKFTAYLTEDQASIPVRIEMSIAIGSISLVLDKVERAGWTP
jgi:hypothetical protein